MTGIDVDAAQVAGWLLVIGSVAFGIGAGNPYLVRAWTAPQETFLAIVARHPVAWRATHVLFIGGTVLTAAGLAALPDLLSDGWPRTLALAGSTAFAIAAVLWIASLIYRLEVTPSTARVFTESGALDPSVMGLDRLNAGLFNAETAAAVVRPSRIPTAAEAREYLESLPNLWAKTSDAGRHGIAEAVFERIDVLGVTDYTFTLTAQAKARGWDAAFGAGVVRTKEGRSGRGERNSAVMSDAGAVVRFVREPCTDARVRIA